MSQERLFEQGSQSPQTDEEVLARFQDVAQRLSPLVAPHFVQAVYGLYQIKRGQGMSLTKAYTGVLEELIRGVTNR